ncbi:Camphor resistance CrcB protein, partial [Candidatus Magnetomorum sp. HK-1]
MLQIFFVGIGGFIGATLRYIINAYVQQFNKGLFFPWGTLTVNLLGCLLIGILLQLNETQQIFSPEIKNLIFIGILGSLTTYSTFSSDAINLLLAQRYVASMLYM